MMVINFVFVSAPKSTDAGRVLVVEIVPKVKIVCITIVFFICK